MRRPLIIFSWNVFSANFPEKNFPSTIIWIEFGFVIISDPNIKAVLSKYTLSFRIFYIGEPSLEKMHAAREARFFSNLFPSIANPFYSKFYSD